MHSGYKYFFYQYVCSLGIEPTTFCAANAILYHIQPQEHITERLFDSRERSNHMRPKYLKQYWFAKIRGQSETSQLELSLKSHAFQKFTDVIDTH